MSWERARQPEQKAIRREAILSAARVLFSELEYEEISLNAIAREAEISKANVYRYFSTREEIFLAIFEKERDLFVDSLTSRLTKTRSSKTVEAIARAWVDVAQEHSTLLNLLPQMSISTEKNSSVEQLVKFKQRGYQRLEKLIETLELTLPTLKKEQWIIVVECAISMMAGLWPLANPGENVIEAMKHPDVNQAPWEFEKLMRHGLVSLIYGTIEANTRR